MSTQPRLFVSVTDNRYLDRRRQAIKHAIMKSIESAGFDPVGFEPHQWKIGRRVNLDVWTVERANELLRTCDGMLVLALARSHVRVTSPPAAATSVERPVPTPYNHLEGALALSRGLPLLVVREEQMDETGIFACGVKSAVIPTSASAAWAKSNAWREHLSSFEASVRRRRDVFLGYCSKANTVAEKLRDHIEASGFTVVDWSRDFKPAGATILEEIESAATRCRVAVFLFTKDDEIKTRATGKPTFDAIPRDNVLLEAGYFTRSHGKRRVAIVREVGAKMPADLGGVIYLSFGNRATLTQTKRGLVRFLREALERPRDPH
jgi:predicted nucleotide-binding protein